MGGASRLLLLAAPFCLLDAASAAQMGGFGSSMMSLSSKDVLEQLKNLYAAKLKPLEEKSMYSDLCEPKLSDAWFDAQPMVMLLGQYSVGKTSFIKQYAQFASPPLTAQWGKNRLCVLVVLFTMSPLSVK